MHDFPIFPFQRAEMKTAFRAVSTWIDAHLAPSSSSPRARPSSLTISNPHDLLSRPRASSDTPLSSGFDPVGGPSPPNGDESLVGTVAGISGDVLEMFGRGSSVSSLDGFEDHEEDREGGEEGEEEEDGGPGQTGRVSRSGSAARRRASWARDIEGQGEEEEEWVRVGGGGRG